MQFFVLGMFVQFLIVIGDKSTFVFDNSDKKIRRSSMEHISVHTVHFLTVYVVFIRESPLIPELNVKSKQNVEVLPSFIQMLVCSFVYLLVYMANVPPTSSQVT